MKKKFSTTEDIELPLLSESKQFESPSKTRAKAKVKSHFLDAFNPEANPSKYVTKLNKLSFITFGECLPLVRRINNAKNPIELKDLPLPFSFYNVEKKVIELDEAWNAQKGQGGNPSIIKAVAKAFQKEILWAALVCFLLINGKLYCSLLMGSFIRNITENNLGDDVDKGEIFFSATMFGLVTAIIVFLENWYWHLAFLIATAMRNTLIGFMYKKLHSVALSSLQEINVGKVINLISNDVNEIDKGFIHMVPTLLSPYTIIIGAILLWNFFGYVTIFAISSLVGFLILSNYLSKLSESVRSAKSAITDERIKLTSELIECIRLVKMYAWEKIFKGAILTLREKEIVKIAKLRALFILGEGVAATSPQSALAIMCIIFAIFGGILSPQKIYTALMILSFTSMWGVSIPHFGMMFFSSCRVLQKRLESVLNIKDVMDLNEAVKSFSTVPKTPSKATPVIFNNYTASWKEGAKPCLSGINLTLNPGELTTVIGTIGSGKTCFLLSFLKEIPETQGQLLSSGKVAYVEQEPIIFSGTIKSNILFGLEFDEHLYNTVLRASNLYEDLKQFDDRDDTVVGERGITLSGGQRARLSLARALYSQSDIYLLDDPLSAVDSKVGRHMFNYAIKGELLKDKIVVLVTHHLNYAKESDRVLLFSEGKIIGDGKFEELIQSDNSLFNKFKEVEEEEKARKSTAAKQSSVNQKNEKVETKPESKTEKKPTGEDNKNEVTFKTYIKYAQQYGKYKNFFGLLLIYLANAGLLIYFSKFVGYWGQAHSDFYSDDQANSGKSFNNWPYILITLFVAISLIFGGVLRSILTNRIILRANSNMHDKALESLIRAPVLFFDQTPIGAVLNRFSNDLGNLDSVNSNQLQIVIDGCIHMIVRIITLIIINPSLALPIILVMMLLVRFRRNFEKPVMETKRIDLASRSPLYSEVSATVNGLLAIRVFRQGGTFIRRFCDLLYNNIRGFLYMERIVRYFSFVMSAALDTLTILGTFVCIFMAFYTNLEAALFGLALLTLQDVAALGGKIVRVSLLVDINMQSVDRIMKYHELQPEAPDNIPQRDNALAKPWPNQGKIALNNVFMKYRPELDYVLKGLTFNVSGGSKVGIVGRTGAGKSSIIQALFRMTELERMPGSSIEIDGVNISQIGLAPLRQSLSIIPQTPVVFTGKIKRNLDPYGHFTDFELWQVLQEVGLRDHVEGLEKKLQTDMTMSSSVFSAGQKQLICLARAILRKSKIIVLDEATANVDIETDDFIQRKIMERFQNCTVITIAHRLITIANYDKVLVMDKGIVAEYDAPYLLLVKNEGDKQITKTDGLFAQMVLNSGDSMAKKIFEIAMNKYYGK